MTQAGAGMSKFRLDGAVALMTGGASGIGRACGELFVQAGARVVLLDRDEQAAQIAANEIGPDARAGVLDVTNAVAVDDAFSDAVSREGRIDVLVNSAGIAIRRPTLELQLEDWQRVVDVNMTGLFLCARAAGRHMVAQQSGAIVNIASIFGLSGGGLYPNLSYQATKGAVVNITRALAIEWVRSGVRVNAVAPTWVRTPFVAGLTEKPELMEEIRRVTPMGRLAEAEEVATATLFLASSAASMITGHTLPVDGGFLAQ
jgi:NAD(P)-dependent dehydrogenase (short-subunit alcohol dehydrogenase family)